MNTYFFIGLRYITRSRNKRFVSFVSIITLGGIALGVMSLIIVLSVMGGFEKEIKTKLLGTYPNLSFEAPPWISEYENLVEHLQKEDSIVSASAYINGEGILQFSKNSATGAIIRGITPDEHEITNIKNYVIAGSIPLKENELLIGSILSRDFMIGLNDRVKIITSRKTKPIEFTVTGIFKSGMYIYDSQLVFTNLSSGQKLFDAENIVNGIGIKVNNPYKIKQIKSYLMNKYRLPYRLISWQDRDRNFLEALKLEKTVMFIILILIVLVACFSITGTLVLLVMEKTKDIGILKSLGASRSFIKKIFTYQGFLFGLTGSVMGGGLGLAICYIISKYGIISLPQDVYYMDRLPVDVQWIEVAVIFCSAVFLSVIAAVYPAIKASGLNPAEALRYE